MTKKANHDVLSNGGCRCYPNSSFVAPAARNAVQNASFDEWRIQAYCYCFIAEPSATPKNPRQHAAPNLSSKSPNFVAFNPAATPSSEWKLRLLRLCLSVLPVSIWKQSWHLATDYHAQWRSNRPGNQDYNHQCQQGHTSRAPHCACASVHHQRNLPPGSTSSRFAWPTPQVFPWNRISCFSPSAPST